MTAKYVTERKAFGQPIGAFQAVAHPIADMKGSTDAVRILVYEAAWLVDNGREAGEEIASTKALANEFFERTGNDAFRFHGANGYSDRLRRPALPAPNPGVLPDAGRDAGIVGAGRPGARALSERRSTDDQTQEDSPGISRPRSRSAPGIRAQVPKTLADLGCRRVALITDEGLVKAGVVEKVLEAFAGHDVEIAGIFDRVRQDNDTRDINECARWYQEIGADGLLAVGGGSVLDTAKAVKVMLGMKAEKITDLIEGHIVFYSRPEAKPLGIPHVSIPTTAGTGAELSASGALFEAETKTKLIFGHRYMSSDFAFLDPELTVTLPPKLTAEPAFDSLSHSIESFFSTRANSMADAFALRSARLVYQNLPIAVENGDDIEARGELQAASAMSVAASVSALGCNPIHNFADAIGPLYGVSHGLANAVYLPIVMRNLASHYRPRIKEFAQGIGVPVDSDDDQVVLDRVIAEFVSLQETCGIPARLSIEIEREQLEGLKAAVREDPAGAGFPLSDDVIHACLTESMTVN